MFMRAVHPGHGVFAADRSATQQGEPDHRGKALDHRRYGSSFRTLVRDRSAVLVEPASAVRPGVSGQGDWRDAPALADAPAHRCELLP